MASFYGFTLDAWREATMAKRYTARDLRKLPTTLSIGQADDLKIETEDVRVWLSRCGVADGEPYENKITVERLIDGHWTVVETYEG